VTVKLAVVQVPHQSAVMYSPSTVRSAEWTIPAAKMAANRVAIVTARRFFPVACMVMFVLLP
jgi:hypothetical protein